MEFLQPRFPQIGPAGDGPRAIFCAQSGMGKTSAALKMIEEYLRIVERVYIVSSTIDLDQGYVHIKDLGNVIGAGMGGQLNTTGAFFGRKMEQDVQSLESRRRSS